MRVLVALGAFMALAAAHHGEPHGVPDLFEGQRQYVYNYRALVATGLPRQSKRYSGLEKYGVLTVQAYDQQGSTKVLGLHLGHVVSGAFDKEVEDIENRRVEGVVHATEEHLGKYGPVFVKLQNNEVQKLRVPQGMPEEVVNIYRGLAAVFTVGKPEGLDGERHPFMGRGEMGEPQPVIYRRQEQGVTGNFETTYEILSDPFQPHNHLNVTKTRNYMKKVGRDGRFFQNGHDEHGCHNVCPTHKPEQVDKNLQPDTVAWDKPVAEGCPVAFHPKNDLVETFTTYSYNMTVENDGKYAVVREAHALDKKILPLHKQQIKTVSVLKLVFVEERPVTQPWNQKDATKQYDDLIYRFPEGHKFDMEYLSLYSKANDAEMLKEQVLPMIKALTDIIASDNLELKSDLGDKVVQLTMAIGALNKQQLQALWTVLGQSVSETTATDFEKVQRKVFVDTVALSGSNDAAQFLLELVQQERLTTLETIHVLETLQKNVVKPTTKTMKELLRICTDTKFQEKRIIFSTACVAFAEVVSDNCGNHKTYQWQKEKQQSLKEQSGRYELVEFCGQQEFLQFIDTVRGQLHSAKEFAQQVIYVQTLGRLSHPEALKALLPYVYGEQEVVAQVEKMTRPDEHESISEYVQFLRQVAIYALHQSARQHGAAVQPVVQGIYFNKQEDYELRVAALSVLLATQPTEATFGRLVIELAHEEDYDVASYTYSALLSLANSTVPCLKQSARRVQNVLGALPTKAFGVHLSKWGLHTQYLPLSNLGVKAHWEVTQSNVSAVPRFMYAGVTTNKGPFMSTLFNAGMISKGFENLDKFIFQKGGMTKIVENIRQRIARDVRTYVGEGPAEKMLEHIEKALQFNTEENNEQPRFVVFGNVLGHETYLPVDKEYLTKVANKASAYVMKVLSQEGVDKTFRYVRILMPRTYVQVAPAVNGLPVLLSNRHPIVVSVSLKDLQTRFGPEKDQIKLQPFVAAISALVQPTVYYTAIHSSLTINPAEKRVAHGVRTVAQTYVTLPIDAAVQYTHQTRTVAVTVRPRFEKIFFHKTRAMTFKTEALLIRDVDKPLLETYTTIKTQQVPFVYDRVFGEKFGMPLRVRGLSLNEEYAVNVMRSWVAGKENVVTALLKEVANEWLVPRTWSVHVEPTEDAAVKEVKLVFRLGDIIADRVKANQNQDQPLSQAQVVSEQAYPEHMRMIAYEHEYQKVTGRKPETERLEQAVERIAKKTEKYWSQVDTELSQKFDKDNIKGQSVEYVLIAKGQKSLLTAISGHLIVASTFSKQATLAEVTVNVEKTPVSFDAQAVVAMTKTPQPFETGVREEEQRGIVGFVAELETRQTGKQHYSGKVEMSKSEEQKQLSKLSPLEKPWYYRRCEKDMQEQKSEVSTACELVRYHKSALNRVRFDIELPQQVHESLTNVSHKIREALKVHLYKNLHAIYGRENTNTQENKLSGVLVYSERFPCMCTANLTLRTPDHEELRFERITVPRPLRPNTMWTVAEQTKAFLRNDRPEPACVYNGQKIRTFDNVTISLKAMKEGEKYVVVHDNDEKPKFTVVVDKKQTASKVETEIQLILRGATLIKLTPPAQQGHYKVIVNQTEMEVIAQKAYVRQYAGKPTNVVILHVEEHKEGQDSLVLTVRDLGMQIKYDGKNLKVKMTTLQNKGQITGLCGNMNNQYTDELTGPRGCKFEREEDFVRAFALTTQAQPMEGDWVCPEGIYPRGASQAEISKKERKMQMFQQKKQLMFQERRTLRREQDQLTQETKMLPLGGKICFSLEPVQSCKDGLRQIQTEMQTVAFTCLQAKNPLTIQLQREIQTQKVATNLPVFAGRTNALVHHEIEVATRCSP
nr:vitellogenin 2-like protein [Dermanyssus gallinae]